MANQHYFLFLINTPQEIQAFWYGTERHWVPSSRCFWESLCLHLQGEAFQSEMSETPHPMTQHHTHRRLALSATPCENLKSCKLPTVLTTASLHSYPPKGHMSSATTQLHRSVSRHGHDTTGNCSVDHIQILASHWLLDLRFTQWCCWGFKASAMWCRCIRQTVPDILKVHSICMFDIEDCSALMPKAWQSFEMSEQHTQQYSITSKQSKTFTLTASLTKHIETARSSWIFDYRKVLQHLAEHLHKNSNYYMTQRMYILVTDMWCSNSGIVNKL